MTQCSADGSAGFSWYTKEGGSTGENDSPMTRDTCLLMGSCYIHRHRHATTDRDTNTQHKATRTTSTQCSAVDSAGLCWYAMEGESTGENDSPMARDACLLLGSCYIHRQTRVDGSRHKHTAQSHTYLSHPMQCCSFRWHMLVCKGRGKHR